MTETRSGWYIPGYQKGIAMNFQNLNYFLVTARELNMTRAAAELHISQQALSSHILKLTEFVTANELATMMNIPVTKVISTCMNVGMMVSINQRLDSETINIVAIVSTKVESMLVVEDNVDLGIDVVEVEVHTFHGRFFLQERLYQ